MAKRSTLKEAEELKVAMAKRHPGAVIVIEEKHSENTMSPCGLGVTYQESDIIKYDGKFPVIQTTTFFVLEVTNCPSCGKEIKSAAIGEFSASCNNCRQSSRTQTSPVQPKPAYGDFQGTGWMDKR